MILLRYLAAESYSADGKMKSYSTPEGCHSAILALFSEGRCDVPADFNREWQKFSKGLRNRIATEPQAGHIPISGSDKLTMDQYKCLCLIAIRSETFFAHGFLVLAWNAMTRSGDTGDIKYEHLSMIGDHISISIPRHKGDSTGESTPTGKAIYANPIFPEVCPFLALSLVLLSRETFVGQDSVIFGSKSKDSFNTWLKGEHLEDDTSNCLNVAHLTSHCTRKGSTSYVVALPGLASVLAVFLRAGWRLGGVLPVYLTQEMAGDQMVRA